MLMSNVSFFGKNWPSKLLSALNMIICEKEFSRKFFQNVVLAIAMEYVELTLFIMGWSRHCLSNSETKNITSTILFAIDGQCGFLMKVSWPYHLNYQAKF